jgi:3'-5' exoribonuclease
MKKSFVSSLSPGDNVDDIFALRKVEFKEFPTGKMISLELGDRTGRIKGVIWSGSWETAKTLQAGKTYGIKGTVTTYRGETQITVEKIEPADNYDTKDFLPTGPYTTAELEEKLNWAMAQVHDQHYGPLLTGIFSDLDFRSSFLCGVGGKLWHHNYVGGLAEHTFGVFALCLDFAARYNELDRDLLLSGALLHDIGKAQSYSLDNYIDYTDPGRLIGHIVIGDEMVKEAITRIPDFPPEKSLKIRHLILSHQGSPEQSSPVPPMMAEGMALYVADLLDSKLAALRRIKQKEHRPGVRWSSYVNLLDRYIYFGEDDRGDGKEDI